MVQFFFLFSVFSSWQLQSIYLPNNRDRFRFFKLPIPTVFMIFVKIKITMFSLVVFLTGVVFVSVNFPVKNLELKDYIPLPTPKENQKLRSKYDLIANIVHDGKPGEGSYRVFVQRKSEELW